MAATELLAGAGGGQVAFEGPAWNSNTVDLIRLARAHCFFVLHSTFADSVQRLSDEVSDFFPVLSLACSLATCTMIRLEFLPLWFQRSLDSKIYATCVY